MLLTTLIYFFSGLLYKIYGAGNCVDGQGMFDAVFTFVLGLLPSFLAPWINMLREYPVCFYVLLLLFSGFILLKIRTWNRTQLLANRAWVVLKKKDLAATDM